MSLRLVLLGPPGSGKGTLAKQLHERLGMTPLSTGELFRNEMKARTALGRQVKEYVANGQLVPDELVVKVMTRRMSTAFLEKGFVLDGFPRTVGQAQGLEAYLRARRKALTGVVSLTCPESLLIRRLSGRQVCARCGAIYHVRRMPPTRRGVCDQCQGKLTVRQDDRVATIRKRLKIDRAESKALIAHYRDHGLLHALNANGTSERVFERAMAMFRRAGWIRPAA